MRYLVCTFLAMATVRLLLGRGRLRHLPAAPDRHLRQRRPVCLGAPCPDGTGAIFLALIGGIIGLFIAAGIYIDPRQAARVADHAPETPGS